MKKIGKLLCIMIVASIIIPFSGCGVYDKIELEKAYTEISTLKTTTIDFSAVKEILEEGNTYFGTLEDVEIEELNINSDYIAKKDGKEVAIVRQEQRQINSVPLSSYMILKPAEDKKELLKEEIQTYYQKLLEEYSNKEDATEEIKNQLSNVMIREYEGYVVCILSNNNEEVWNLIKEHSHALLFQNIKRLQATELKTEFLLNENDLKEFLAVIPSQDTSASFYIIVRPKNGKMDDVKKILDQYMKNLEKKWSTYLPAEYQLVKNRMDTEIGSYLVYIISKDNDLVLKTIKDAILEKN